MGRRLEAPALASGACSVVSWPRARAGLGWCSRGQLVGEAPAQFCRDQGTAVRAQVRERRREAWPVVPRSPAPPGACCLAPGACSTGAILSVTWA